MHPKRSLLSRKVDTVWHVVILRHWLLNLFIQTNIFLLVWLRSGARDLYPEASQGLCNGASGT